jgi:hypothetical protein
MKRLPFPAIVIMRSQKRYSFFSMSAEHDVFGAVVWRSGNMDT